MEKEEASRGESGHVVCGSWIRRPKKVNWAIIARAAKRRGSSSPALLHIFSFDPITTSLSSSPLVIIILFLLLERKKKSFETISHGVSHVPRPFTFCWGVLTENLGCFFFKKARVFFIYFNLPHKQQAGGLTPFYFWFD